MNLDDYFDNMFKNIDKNIKLDEEQRTAILTDKKYNMIVAGAGSGKTTTMAAKVKYLVEIKKINPKNIVIISFTNKAVDELKERIQKDFKIPCLIYTFHKFGLVLLNNKKQIQTDIYSFVLDFFEEQFNNNTLRQFIKYFPEYFLISKINFLFKDLKTYHKYKTRYCKLLHKKQPKIDKYCQPFILLCIDFIQKIKIRNIDIETIKYKNKKEELFLSFIKLFLNYYQNKLIKENKIDFDDIIIDATKINTKLNYQYIIVDEYQDISMQRFMFIKHICKLSNAKLTVVGDDFQTIYSFSGSQIELFTDFSKLVGESSLLKITNTYRNSQQLIDIAGKFVMKNENQIKKKLISNKSLNNPIIIVLYKEKNKVDKLYFCIKEIIKEYGENQNILLLGRYNFDINPYLGKVFKKINNKIEVLNYPNLKVTFLSVHSAKGLGFDQVIILNVNDELYGFPSKVVDDDIMKLLGENNSLLEERRLFYVALTRTKNKVYILSNKEKISKFVLEIMRECVVLK